MEWRKDEIDLTINRLSPSSRQIVNGIISGVFLGIPAVETLYVGDSSIRITTALDYVRKHRLLPGTLIVLEEAGVFDLVDGCHRAALLVFLQRNLATATLIEEKQSAWPRFFLYDHALVYQALGRWIQNNAGEAGK